MKVTFYRSILQENNLSPTDKIVFCQVLYLSLMEKGGVTFDSEGKFNLDTIKSEYDGYVPIPKWLVNDKNIVEMLNTNRRQYYQSCKNLKNACYIIKNEWGEKLVKLIDLIPYFELDVDTELSGLELIVYSYMAHKCKKYEWLDKYHQALADDLCLSYQSLTMILHKLYKKGFLERMRKGHYVYLRVK